MFDYCRLWKGEVKPWESVDREELINLERYRQYPEGTVESIENKLEPGQTSIILQSPGAYYKIKKCKVKQLLPP